MGKTMMKKMLALGLAAMLTSPAIPAVQSAPVEAARATIVHDRAALLRLKRNSGITLQWISFESPARGHVYVTERNGIVSLSGAQRGNGGTVIMDGFVREIDARSFRFVGTITITDTPDPGRVCVREGGFEFRITQNRRYWRLQQMEACDGLTDYVDIYF